MTEAKKQEDDRAFERQSEHPSSSHPAGSDVILTGEYKNLNNEHGFPVPSDFFIQRNRTTELCEEANRADKTIQS